MFCYSPHLAGAYRITGFDACEVSLVQSHPKAVAIWNLFWLSCPGLDALPNSGYSHWKVYKPTSGLLAAVIHDVQDDEALFRKLRMSPRAFMEWFERDEHDNYELYALLGPAWVSTVLMRAEAAAMRLFGVPTVYADGRGIRIDFEGVK